MDFIATLRTAREERCLSPEAVAQGSGLHPQTIRKAESGSTKSVSVENLRAWAKALGYELILQSAEFGTEMRVEQLPAQAHA